MKFTLGWLKDHLQTDKPLDEIVQALLELGIEVENIENYQEKFKDFSVGFIKSVAPHPDANKLQVCQVETKDGELQIVCGAPNAKAGIYVIYAPVGSYIPGLDITIKKTLIRGVESNGMMVSEKELLISEEHNGIIEMSQGKVGQSAAEALNLNDIVIEIAITPNRGDLLGVRGIAKDLAAYGVGTLKPLKYNRESFAENINSQEDGLTLEVNPDISKKFLLRKINNVNNNLATPVWLKNKLQLIGQRSINPLVDITNYVCFTLNQPLHAYDANKVISKEVKVDFAKNNTKAILLDNKEYTLDSTMPLVLFGSQIGALAGVKGGLDSSCDYETQAIYLEAAHFDNKLVAFSKRRTEQNTEASYRYEREIDIANIEEALDFATALIIKICGGEAYKAAEFNISKAKEAIEVSLDYINQLSGYNFSVQEVADILNKLNFTLTVNNNIFRVVPPSYRNDIDAEHVVVAEIIRLFKVENLPALQLEHSNLSQAYDDSYSRKLLAKHTMAALGYQEHIGMSFVAPKLAEAFEFNYKDLTLYNPISEDLSVMRGSMIPTLLVPLQKNINNSHEDLRIFESGNIYNLDSSSLYTIGAVITGDKTVKTWHTEEKTYQVWDIKSDVISLLSGIGLNVDNIIIDQNELPRYMHPGKSAIIKLGKTKIATFGQINPLTLTYLGFKKDISVYFLEIFLDNIPLPKNKVRKNPIQLSVFTPIKRDFAFIVDTSVKAAEILKLIKLVDKKHITTVNIFDIYKDQNMQANKVSIAFNVVIESYDKTFTDEEIQTICNKIVTSVEKGVKATLRT